MGCWQTSDRWHEHARDRAMRKAERWMRRHGQAPSSGNRAFDEYRTETLRRLEEEEGEFHQFLDRLRMAKDKAEFDEFLADRRRRAAEGPAPDQRGPDYRGPDRDRPDHDSPRT